MSYIDDALYLSILQQVEDAQTLVEGMAEQLWDVAADLGAITGTSLEQRPDGSVSIREQPGS